MSETRDFACRIQMADSSEQGYGVEVQGTLRDVCDKLAQANGRHALARFELRPDPISGACGEVAINPAQVFDVRPL